MIILVFFYKVTDLGPTIIMRDAFFFLFFLFGEQSCWICWINDNDKRIIVSAKADSVVLFDENLPDIEIITYYPLKLLKLKRLDICIEYGECHGEDRQLTYTKFYIFILSQLTMVVIFYINIWPIVKCATGQLQASRRLKVIVWKWESQPYQYGSLMLQNN